MSQRIVLDTNCLLQIIPLRSPFRHLWEAFVRGDYRLCVSTEILEEYHEVLTRVSSPAVADNILWVIENSPHTEFFSPHFRFRIIEEDPDDNKFVDCAIVAQARYIVSDDRHFDAVRSCPFPRVEVLTLPEFNAVMNQ